MKQGKLRILEGNRVAFWCTGCEEYHAIPIEEGNPVSWGFNKDYDNPTFTPSVLVRSRRFTDKGEQEYDTWAKAGYPKPAPVFDSMEIVCHSFVTNGKIQYLSDCTHKYADQTVDIEVKDY